MLLAACLLWLIGSGAASLMKNGSASPDSAQQGDVCEFTAIFADEAFEVKHTINFIPTGKDHYYLMASEDGLVQFLVRAKPSWINKRFADSGFAESGEVKIKGRVTRMDYKLTKEVIDMNNELIQDGTFTAAEAPNVNFYIDARYKEFGRLRLLCGVGIVVLGVLFFLSYRSGVLQSNKAVATILVVAALGVALLTIHTLSVGGSGI